MDYTATAVNDSQQRMLAISRSIDGPTTDVSDRPFPLKQLSENHITTISSNSRFRSLFSRKKSSPAEDLRSVDVESTLRPTSSAASQHHPSDNIDPVFEHLSRKDTIASRRSQQRSKSRSRRRVSPSASESTQPLTLGEAYARASLNSVLQIPTKSFRDWLPISTSRSTSRRHSAISTDLGGEEANCRSPLKAEFESTTQDVRMSNNYQLTEKLFFLCDHGMIFQYKTDGLLDRLPEKSFRILPESVAFASDAITGKHWVLDITVSSNSIDDVKSTNPWSAWSRLSFRSIESKSATENLLIAFDSPELMSTWLAAIRREIDLLGGLSYRPDTPQKDPDPRSSTLRSASSERASLKSNFLRFSRSASNLRNELYDPTKIEKDLPRLPVPNPSSYQKSISGRSVAASSIATTTSLDRLKDADNGSTTTATTNSLDGSVALESPIKAVFADITSPIPSIETRSNISPEKASVKEPVSTQASLDRQKYTVSQSHRRSVSGSVPSQKQSRPPLRTIESETLVSGIPIKERAPDDPRPVSVLMPLPSADDLKRPSPTQQHFPPEIVTHPPRPEAKRSFSNHSAHVSKLSTDSQTKSMYSLFPKKTVTEVKTEPLIIPDANPIPGLPSNHATDHLDMRPSPVISLSPAPMSLTSRPVPVQRPSALKLLAAPEVEQPERSPAVSADMLASNFGTSPIGLNYSPVSPSKIQVPSFEDLQALIGLKESRDSADDVIGSANAFASTDFAVLKRQKSTPNFHSSFRAPSAPVGPPPKGPLPAVPDTDRSSTSSLTNSQLKRGSIQGNRERSIRSPSLHGAPRPQSSYKRPRSKSQVGKNTHAEHSCQNSIIHIATPPLPPSSPPRNHNDSFGIPSVVYRLSPERNSNTNNHQYTPSIISVKSSRSLRQK